MLTVLLIVAAAVLFYRIGDQLLLFAGLTWYNLRRLPDQPRVRPASSRRRLIP